MGEKPLSETLKKTRNVVLVLKVSLCKIILSHLVCLRHLQVSRLENLPGTLESFGKFYHCIFVKELEFSPQTRSS